jgi:hypothetical protein
MWERATLESNAPENMMSDFVQFLHNPPTRDDASRWCDRAAAGLTDYSDTHPSFADRVRAVGLRPMNFRKSGFPIQPAPSAAELLLSDSLERMRRDVSALWHDEVKSTWHGRHVQATLLERQLAGAESGATPSEAALDPLWEKAQTVLALKGPQAAEPLLRDLVAMKPTHSAANFVLGKHLLDRLNEEGTSYLQRILDAEGDDFIPRACATLAEYFQAVGDADGVHRVRKRLDCHQFAAEKSRVERTHVGPRDSLLPHQLSQAELNELLQTLQKESSLDGAWLVQKKLEYFPKQRLFILALQTATNLLGRSNATLDAQIVNRVIPQLRLPGRSLVISPTGTFRKLAKRVVSFDGSRIV